MNLIEHALDFAHNAHRGQKRKDGITPYIVHPIEVMRLLQQCGVVDAVTLAIALLHDTVEDTPITIDKLRYTFGKDIADAVQRLTKPEDMSKEDFIETFAHYSKSQQAVLRVKVADRICNSRDFWHNGDHKYADKYLNIKGAPIFQGLINMGNGNVDRELHIEWYKLQDQLEGRYDQAKEVL